jgi:hypothetical protein
LSFESVEGGEDDAEGNPDANATIAIRRARGYLAAEPNGSNFHGSDCLTIGRSVRAHVSSALRFSAS